MLEYNDYVGNFLHAYYISMAFCLKRTLTSTRMGAEGLKQGKDTFFLRTFIAHKAQRREIWKRCRIGKGASEKDNIMVVVGMGSTGSRNPWSLDSYVFENVDL